MSLLLEHPASVSVDTTVNPIDAACGRDWLTAGVHVGVQTSGRMPYQWILQARNDGPLEVIPMMTNHTNNKPFGSILTRWQMIFYDVSGNSRDGYEVSNMYSHGEIEIFAPQTVYNVGTKQEFIGASPSDRQVKRAFGVRCRISTDGDDLTIYVNRSYDSYPIGELQCVSHESLSLVRKRS